MSRPHFNPVEFKRATYAICDSMDEDYHRCSSPTCRSNKRLADELVRAGETPTTGYFAQQLSGGDGRQTPLSETELLTNRRSPVEFRRATHAMCDSMDEDYHRCSSPTCRSNKRLMDELARAGASTPTTGYFAQPFSGGDGRQTPLSETEQLMNRRSGELRCKNKDEDYHRCKSPTCRPHKRLLDELERAERSPSPHKTSFDESYTRDLKSPDVFTDFKEQRVHDTQQASVRHQDRDESRLADTKSPMISRYDSIRQVESKPKVERIMTAVYRPEPVKLERQAFHKHAVKPSLPCFACHLIHDNDVTAFGITEDECRRRYLFGTCVQCKQGRSDFQYCHNCHLADDYSLFYEEDSDTDSD